MDSPKQPDVTRARILRSAFTEIYRQGFQAASLNTILADTGLTKGALYHHFPTKQALGLAVVDEVIKERIRQLMCEPIRSSAKPIDALMAVIGTISDRMPPHYIELGCPLNNLIQEMSPLDEQFKEHLSAVLEMWRSTVLKALVEGQRQGAIRPEVDCAAAALFIVSAWEGCRGVAKNLQSLASFSSCMQQLHGYVAGLRTPAET